MSNNLTSGSPTNLYSKSVSKGNGTMTMMLYPIMHWHWHNGPCSAVKQANPLLYQKRILIILSNFSNSIAAKMLAKA